MCRCGNYACNQHAQSCGKPATTGACDCSGKATLADISWTIT
jgi:hypothetical protein